jgi:CRISPR-associated RAMP protein (TIGR02581 family)
VEPQEFRPRLHGRLERLALMELELTCRTGLHIGAGKRNDLAGSDQPVIRDAGGRPLVPGSSLRGVLRTGAEAVCSGLGLDAVADPGEDTANLSEPVAKLLSQWRSLSVVERLFGPSPERRDGFSLASRLQVSDAATDGPVVVELRDGVGIERDSRTASPGIKYDLEVVPAGTRFRGAIRFKNPADFELGLLAQVLWMLDTGALLLGGKSARGLGWMSVSVTAPRILDAEQILARAAEAGADRSFGPVEEKLAPYLETLERLASTARASRP